MIKISTNTYQKVFKVLLGDTSAYGNVYYLTYHKWISAIKEIFFFEKVKGFSDLFRQQGMKLFVVHSKLKLLGEATLHSNVNVEMHCSQLKKLKARLTYKCINDGGEILAEAENIIVFVNSKNELLPIPDDIREVLLSISTKTT